MNILVVMDGPETVNAQTDTSFALMVAAQAHGHSVWHCQAGDLELADGRVWARAARASADESATPPLQLAPVERLDLGPAGPTGVGLASPPEAGLGAVDAVLIRTDPPFESTYLHLTLVVEHVVHHTLVVNSPRGLREANEKLFALRFPTVIPPTIVSSDAATLSAFAEAHGAAVLKPIDGHGGRGVMALRPGDSNGPSIIDTLTDRGRRPVMAQRFLPEVSEGDKRILLLDGEPLGAILRLPTESDFRANICVGGTTVATDLDDADRRIIEAMAPELRALGLTFVGLDVVGGHLTEVNVTSPTGIRQLASLTGTDPAARVIEWIEHQVTSQG